MTPLASAQAVRAQSTIDNDLVDLLVKHQQKGDQLMFLRTHNGRVKIKVKYGPLKYLVKRFITNSETFDLIKQKIALKH